MSESTPPSVGVNRKRAIILGVVELVVLLIIFVKVIPQIGSYSDAADSLRAMSIGALLTIGAAVLVYLAWYGLPFVAAAPGLSYPRAQQINQGAFAIGNGIPGGGAFGLGVQYAMFASFKYPAARATAAIAAVGVWSVLVTLGFPILGVVAQTIDGEDGSGHVLAASLGLVALVAAVTIFALVIRSESAARKLGALANRAAALIPARWRKDREIDLVPAVLDFRTGIADLAAHRWAHISVAQVGVSFTQFLILYVALRGIEEGNASTTTFLAAFAAFAISQLGLMIPVTPGGLGTVDAALVALLVAAGTTTGDATAAALVWRASSFIPQIIIGIVALALWGRNRTKALATAE